MLLKPGLDGKESGWGLEKWQFQFHVNRKKGKFLIFSFSWQIRKYIECA